jgi:hypothetical protein
MKRDRTHLARGEEEREEIEELQRPLREERIGQYQEMVAKACDAYRGTHKGKQI